ncbi:MAG: hypothetical protein OXG11_05450 [Chloroflexi bacterium]|nr:hypothetical protein [Chloroflexota bacterium]
MNPFESITELVELGAAVVAAASLGLLIVVVAVAAIIAYLAVKAHASGYLTFSLRAAVTWYAHLIQALAVVMLAVGTASLLNVGVGAAAGPGYSFPEGVTSADFPSIIYEAVVLFGTGLIVLLVHQRFERLVDPNRAGRVARLFRLAALSAAFGIAVILLLLFSGLSLVEYHVESAGGPAPGRMLSGLAVAIFFWIHALLGLKREIDSNGE